LDATAAMSIISVALKRECRTVNVLEVDTILESGLREYLENNRNFKVMESKRHTLLTLKPGINVPHPAKTSREGTQIRLLGHGGDEDGLSLPLMAGGQYCGVFFEGTMVVLGSISAVGALGPLRIQEGYG